MATTETAPASSVTWATGRRKEAIARVRLLPGAGTITVNNRSLEQYFVRGLYQTQVRQPLQTVNAADKFNVIANVAGGGLTGQAGAVRLGIARALAAVDPALRLPLRKGGFLTRDSRVRERKKYGQKGARKRFQWTKR